jgi:hypothetical protein
MSASEKLKNAAPWDQWREYCNSDVLDLIESDDMDRLLNALPQIVAVVEAAETLPMLFDVVGGSTIKTLSFVPLLDALEEALS